MSEKKEEHYLWGWKAIAGFLGRDIRTCQRYEQELKLPVQRGPAGGIFALKADIRKWLLGEGEKLS